MSKNLKHIFRITHIKNIPHILVNGIVRSDSPNRNPNYVPIGDQSIIKIRKGIVFSKDIPLNSIPFYFGPRSPMLYVIQKGYNGVESIPPQDIVYLVMRVEDIINKDIDCVFTDGHAISAITSFYPKEKLKEINDIISYDDVFSKFWTGNDKDPDLKRRKEAELLVKQDLPPELIKYFVVYNEQAKDILINFGVEESIIIVKSSYYF